MDRARKAHMAHEKEFTRARDRLSEERRALPWVKVDTAYSFDSGDGNKTLAELFAGRSQLVVQHFMFAPEWNEGCKSCSFWADGFERMIPHLAARDTTLVAVSRAPLAKLDAFKKRMAGPSIGSLPKRATSTSTTRSRSRRTRSSRVPRYIISVPPASASMRRPASACSTATKGATSFTPIRVSPADLDMMNAAYHYLDLTPLGRHEEGLPYPMDWLRLRDQYTPAPKRGGVAVMDSCRPDEF